MLAVALIPSAPLTASAQGGPSIRLIRDAEIENIIRAYMAPVLRSAGMIPEDIEVHLVMDRRLNAFVAGGNHIFINTGLLMRAKHAGQVIGVLAHETGHITGGHLVRIHQAMEGLQVQSILTFLLAAGAGVLAGSADAALAAMALGSKVIEGQFLKYSRAHESAADHFAVGALDRAGISARGYREFLEILRSQEFLVVGRQDPYVRTHPVTSSRIEFVRRHEARSPHSGAQLPARFDEMHRRMRAKLFGFLAYPLTVLARYKPDDERIEARYARAIAYHREFDTAKALRLMDGLLAERPRDPYFLELKGQILFESGRVAASIPPYRAAVKLLPNSTLIRTALGQALLELQTDAANREARQHLRAAVRADPRNPLTWRLFGVAQGRSGQIGLASLSLAEEGLLRGDRRQVMGQLARARKHLKKGTPGWQRAEDIRRMIKQADKNG